jgi:hypothetical protein
MVATRRSRRRCANQPVSSGQICRGKQAIGVIGKDKMNVGNGDCGPMLEMPISGDLRVDVQVPDYSIYGVPNYDKFYNEIAQLGGKGLATEQIMERLRDLGNWYERIKQILTKQNQKVANESSVVIALKDVQNTAWYRQICLGLIAIEKNVIARLERVYVMQKSTADTAFEAECKAVMRAADVEFILLTFSEVLHVLMFVI